MISVVIMAGGKGERFWPKSRINSPKQFLSLTDDGKSMIQHTVERLKDIVEFENIYVVTNELYKSLVNEHIPEIPKENIIVEPVAKNTAPCIGLAAIHIAKKNPESKMIVLPADHLIKFNEIFTDTLKTALDVVENGDNLATIGITPNYPETGYGYINFKRGDSLQKNVYEVLKFEEKPNIEKAKEYLASGQYLWNSGMFIWKTSTILRCFKEFLPEIYNGLEVIETSIGTNNYEKVLKEEFVKLPSESIDYGVMEKAENIYVIPGNFGWDDVGSWDSFARHSTGTENTANIGSENCFVYSDIPVALCGVKDLNVVIKNGKALIMKKGSDNLVRDAVKYFKTGEDSKL